MISLIAAVARNGVIGDAGGRFGLPWHIPADLKRFRQLTMDRPLIFGRTTWELIGRPLPGRRVIVLTRQPDWAGKGVEVAGSLDAALALVAAEPEVFIGGGAQVYAQALPRADRLYLTEVDLDAAGDTRFPAFDRRDWRQQDRHHHEGDPAFTFVVYARPAA